MRALIFDCDGVLADTERHGHLPAFNQMFREVGLPIVWSEDEYGALLKTGGGKERIARVLDENLLRGVGVDPTPDATAAAVGAWHRRKTEIFVEMVTEGRIEGRPGVRRLAASARDAGWRLAVASTSAESSVRAILWHAVGASLASVFDPVLAGDVVARKKPQPDIYLEALARLGIRADDAVAIEDSGIGAAAAAAAGIRCLVTTNAYTLTDSFERAALVVDSLGEPDSPLVVIDDPNAITPSGQIEVSDLEAILTTQAPFDHARLGVLS